MKEIIERFHLETVSMMLEQLDDTLDHDDYVRWQNFDGYNNGYMAMRYELFRYFEKHDFSIPSSFPDSYIHEAFSDDIASNRINGRLIKEVIGDFIMTVEKIQKEEDM